MRKRSATEVEVDYKHAFFLNAERESKVVGNEGLAGAWIGGGNGNDGGMAGFGSHEFEVGAHYTEGLIDDVAAMRLYHDEGIGILALSLVAGTAESLACVFLAGLRNFAYKRSCKIFDILASAHHGVEHFFQHDNHKGNSDTDYSGDKENHSACRCCGSGRTIGSAYHACVIGREGL